MNIYKSLYKATKNKYNPNDKYGAIYHDNGYLVATNGHILAKIKADYSPELEGKIIAPDGKEVNETYMKYQSFLDAIDRMQPVSTCNLLQACKNVVKFKDPEKNNISLRPDFNVRAKFILDGYDILGKDAELYIPEEGVITCCMKSGDSRVLICSVLLRDDVEVSDLSFTVDEAMTLVIEKKVKKEWYEK